MVRSSEEEFEILAEIIHNTTATMVRHTLIRSYYILLFVVHNDVKVTLPTKANGYKSSAKPVLLAHNLYIFSITFDKLLRKVV